MGTTNLALAHGEMSKTVVILGAGWAGLPLAHKLLKYTAKQVSLKVILVSPNTHFFWNVAATRGIIPDAIPDDQLFLPIEPAFASYPKEQFEFLLGSARSIDEVGNTVTVGTAGLGVDNKREAQWETETETERIVRYDHLVVATGSKMSGDLPLKPLGTHDATLKLWHQLQQTVKTAKTIVVSGAGGTGVEVAGELAARYGTDKKITLIVSGDTVLSSQHGLLPSVINIVEADLGKLGVALRKNTRVQNVVTEHGLTTNLTLSNGEVIQADLYLPLHGIELNTSFVPREMLDAQGNLNLDAHLRVLNTENIWGIGDVGNIEAKQLTVTDNQIIHLAAMLDKVLKEQQSASKAAKGDVVTVDAVKEEEGLVPYKPDGKVMAFISLGKKHATGQIGNWKLFGFMVSWVKGRKLFVDTAQGYVGGKHLRHASM